MNKRKAVLVISIVLTTFGIIGVSIHDAGSAEQTDLDADAPPEETFVAALQQPHDAASYEMTYTYRDAGDGDTTGTRLAVLSVDNEAERFYLERYNEEPPGQLYGTPVTRWGSIAGSDEWEMRTTTDRSLNYFTDLPTLDAGTVRVHTENETAMVLELEDDELIDEVSTESYFRASAYTNESWLRVHVDTENDRLDKVVYYRQDDGEPGAYQVQEYDNYGSTGVNRPDDIPFSLRENVRWSLYRAGLL